MERRNDEEKVKLFREQGYRLIEIKSGSYRRLERYWRDRLEGWET